MKKRTVEKIVRSDLPKQREQKTERDQLARDERERLLRHFSQQATKERETPVAKQVLVIVDHEPVLIVAGHDHHRGYKPETRIESQRAKHKCRHAQDR